jgi:putative ABC transport system permease protein
MAGLSLLLGLILVYNTINAVISEQVQQIGVMKAIGASVGQILQIYLINVLVYGILAWLVAAPLGALGAYGLAYFLVDAFNTEPGPFAVSAQAILAQAALALLLPLLVALGPVFAGARITVREAINTYGLGATSGLLECLLARFQSVSRLLLLTLSNAFRNKGRVVLTQMALVGSGLIFMMVISVSNSVAYTYGELLFSILSFDVNLQFETPERIEAIEGLTQAYPGVKHVELWGASVAKTRPVYRPEANDDKNAQLFGLPIPTALYHPQLRAGRWLEPADRHAVVLNQKLADRIGVKVGDRIVFDFGVYGESNWQVVGLLFDPIFPHSAYVPRETLLREIRSVHRATTVWVQAESGDAAAEVTLAQGLRTFYDRRKIKVTAQPIYFKDTASQLTEQILSNFSVVISLLEVVAVVIGLVGAVALSGILSLGVLERRREIGVMRAVGASSATIAMMFIGEGLFMGWLSWLVALPLSIPAGYLFTWVLGIALDGEMIYVYDPLGGVYWLLIITILSVLASWFPARSATQISVRESLAYQ